MVDVVANHMGWMQDVTAAFPFNKVSWQLIYLYRVLYFVPSCWTNHCRQNIIMGVINALQDAPSKTGTTNLRYNFLFFRRVITNQTWTKKVEMCRVSRLLDLDQSNKFVSEYLVRWVRDIVRKYNIDGIRIDTFPEVDKPFWWFPTERNFAENSQEQVHLRLWGLHDGWGVQRKFELRGVIPISQRPSTECLVLPNVLYHFCSIWPGQTHGFNPRYVVEFICSFCHE